MKRQVIENQLLIFWLIELGDFGALSHGRFEQLEMGGSRDGVVWKADPTLGEVLWIRQR